MQLTIITGNKLKQEMYSQYLDSKLFSVDYKNIDLIEIQSDHPKKISLNKANQAFMLIKVPVVTDDVGFYIKKYKSFPGVYIKHTFQGLGIQNFLKLFKEGDEAEIICTLAFKSQNTEKVFIGKIVGSLTKRSKNINQKNPLSSIFIPEGHNDVMENLTTIENHRMIAIKKLVRYLQNENY